MQYKFDQYKGVLSMKEIFFVINAVRIRDTWNGDIPNWFFYVSSLDLSYGDDYEKIGRYVRGNTAITVIAKSDLEAIPTVEQGKLLARWQYDYMKNPYDVNLKDYPNWLTSR